MPNLLLTDYLLEADFFDQPATLRLQFDWYASVAAGALARPGGAALPDGGAPFVASADQIFSEHALWNFLHDLRAWARSRLRSAHASTPRLQAFVCQPAEPPDVPPNAGEGSQRYLYALCPGEALDAALLPAKPGVISLARAHSLALGDNGLLSQPVTAWYSLRRRDPQSGDGLHRRAVVLEGFLW
ncbi:MAG: hypothetical protein ACRD1C_03105 [Terriglobales bacterium]